MPIPFRQTENRTLGLAAFLRVIAAPDGGAYQGALFVVNALGEPVEFCFSRVDVPRTVLWRKSDLVRRVTADLATALLKACSSSPVVLLARAEEVGPELFAEDVPLGIPCCRVASSLAAVAVGLDEHEEEDSSGGRLHLIWPGGLPEEGSRERLLVDRLQEAGLISEPFERIEAGLREVTREVVALHLGEAVAVPLVEHEGPAPSRRPAARARTTGGRSSVRPAVSPPDGCRSTSGLVERLRAVLAVPVAKLLPVTGSVLDWPGELHPFQCSGVGVLLTQLEVLLADDMGLGKTIQAITALRILLRRGEAESALVVVPAGLIYQWRGELGRWAPEMRVSTIRGSPEQRASRWRDPAHVFLTSYETLRSDFSPHPACGPRRRIWDVVVLDEAQKIKNREAEVSSACKMIPRRRSWALTGTPLENSLDDLASLLEFLQPNEQGQRVAPMRPGPELRARHRQVQLRRRKADVLKELPAKTVHQVILDLTPEQRRAYRRAEQEGKVELRRKGETVTITHVLQLITKLKQICNFCPESGRSAKLEDLAERLAVLKSEGHRMLVFTQFTDDVFGAAAIARGLREYSPLTYTGDLSPSERQARIESFKRDDSHRALILSLRAGGQGLNLQEASYVAHFDRWWNPAIEAQAEGRSHRMGQTSPVTVYSYTCAGTVEERIAHVLEEKQRLFDLVVDEVTLDLDRLLTAEELFGLFDLAPPSAARRRADVLRGPASFRDFTGREFEEYVAALLRGLGYAVEVTPYTRDGGVDLVARQTDEIGLEKVLYVQCKDHSTAVGVEVVRSLLGILPPEDTGARAVLVCPAGFSAEARRFAKGRGVRLIDESSLRELARRVTLSAHGA